MTEHMVMLSRLGHGDYLQRLYGTQPSCEGRTSRKFSATLDSTLLTVLHGRELRVYIHLSSMNCVSDGPVGSTRFSHAMSRSTCATPSSSPLGCLVPARRDSLYSQQRYCCVTCQRVEPAQRSMGASVVTDGDE